MLIRCSNIFKIKYYALEGSNVNSKQWRYNWLFSCPGIIILSHIVYKSREGLVTLPVIYPRINILYNRIEGYRIIGQILSELNLDIVEELCFDISRGKMSSDDFISTAFINTMYYGGYNVFLEINSEAVLVVSEPVNTSSLRFYYRILEEPVNNVSHVLEPWIILGVGLRTGKINIVLDACSEVGIVKNDYCFIKNGGIEILILEKNKKPPNNSYKHFIPDNNGLRHVVKI